MAGSEVTAPRLAEVVAALSLATDVGLGQPMEHGLRSCLIATRLAEALELDPPQLEATYWVSLLAMAGCTGDSSEMAAIFGDDIEFRRGFYDIGSVTSAVPALPVLAGRVRRRRGAPGPRRGRAGGDAHGRGHGGLRGRLRDHRAVRGAPRAGCRRQHPAGAEVRALGREGGPTAPSPASRSQSRRGSSGSPGARRPTIGWAGCPRRPLGWSGTPEPPWTRTWWWSPFPATGDLRRAGGGLLGHSRRERAAALAAERARVRRRAGGARRLRRPQVAVVHRPLARGGSTWQRRPPGAPA